MNILIAKTDPIRFGTCRPKEISFGAVDLAALFFRSLADAYKEHTFYFVGSNDISSVEDVPSNIVDIYTDIKQRAKISGKAVYKEGVDYCKDHNLKFDKAIVWYGITLSVSQYDGGYLTKSGTPRKFLTIQKNGSNGLALATQLHLPVCYVLNDPRQLNCIPYDVDEPALVVSQMNGTVTCKAYKPDDKINMYTRNVNVVYKPIETLWLLSKKKVDWRNFDKNIEFNFAVNGFPYRIQYIQKWILNYMPDTQIYGQWMRPQSLWDSVKAKKLENNFVFKPMTTIEDEMFATKYTLIIPLKKDFPEFVTQKAISMIYYGIIPFWCPDDYDKGNIYSDFPDYIKVKSPEEFYDKVKELDSNKELYNDIKNKLYDVLLSRYDLVENHLRDTYYDIINF